jgi:hypothetical protein
MPSISPKQQPSLHLPITIDAGNEPKSLLLSTLPLLHRHRRELAVQIKKEEARLLRKNEEIKWETTGQLVKAKS